VTSSTEALLPLLAPPADTPHKLLQPDLALDLRSRVSESEPATTDFSKQKEGKGRTCLRSTTSSRPAAVANAASTASSGRLAVSGTRYVDQRYASQHAAPKTPNVSLRMAVYQRATR
jgi:hypothetical protein